MIVNIKRWLGVPLARGEGKQAGGAGLELRRVGDAIRQRFVHRSEEGIDAGFPVVMTGMACDVGTRVTFAVAAVLRGDDRSGQIVRTQNEAGVAHASGKAPQQICRTDVLIINLSGGFGVARVLALTSGLLHQLVGNGVAGIAARNRESQAGALREITLVRGGKTLAISPIC